MTRFDQLGEHIAQEQDALRANAGYQAEVRARLAALELPPAKPELNLRRAAPWLWASAGVSAVAACVFVVAGLRKPEAAKPPLALFVGTSAEPVPAGRWLEAPASGQIGIRFSDGSHIEVAERSRARVVDLHPAGADVLLENGLLHVQVRHQHDSDWHINAGPFGVHVTGTRFDVRWRPEEDAFELSLRDGQVEVSGCVFGQGYRMQAGQTIRASCRDERFDVSAHALPLTMEPVKAEISVQPAPQPVAATPEANTDSDKPKRSLSWQRLAQAGRFAEALTAAKDAGLETERKHASAAELLTLADLARYAHDPADESRALRMLRQRFPSTKRASLAAFGLGRLAFDNHGSYAEAAEWFRLYLKEQPKGTLAREASGRLLEALSHSGRGGAARELATQYLRDYPAGPHAEIARGLASGSASTRR